jgi:hypothetical protein
VPVWAQQLEQAPGPFDEIAMTGQGSHAGTYSLTRQDELGSVTKGSVRVNLFETISSSI